MPFQLLPNVTLEFDPRLTVDEVSVLHRGDNHRVMVQFRTERIAGEAVYLLGETTARRALTYDVAGLTVKVYAGGLAAELEPNEVWLTEHSLQGTESK